MRPPTFEFALDKMFDYNVNDVLQAVHPLSSEKFLASKDFQLGVSFVFGDKDYMIHLDDNQSKKLIE